MVNYFDCICRINHKRSCCKTHGEKQQMQWAYVGAHYLIQTIIAVLNNELHKHFKRWFSGFGIDNQGTEWVREMKKAA